jgi:hypothetical protein
MKFSKCFRLVIGIATILLMMVVFNQFLWSFEPSYSVGLFAMVLTMGLSAIIVDWIPTFDSPPPISVPGLDPRLTIQEKDIIASLVVAWELYLNLPDDPGRKVEDFKRFINDAQSLIAYRVARRVEPHYWA